MEDPPSIQIFSKPEAFSEIREKKSMENFVEN
jgi:hypothetical protein